MPNPYAAPSTDVPTPTGANEPHHPIADPPRKKPKIRPNDRFVLAHTATDFLDAEVITQMLQAEGIATPGTSQLTGASVGAGNTVVSHQILVTESQLELAQELIATYLAGAPDVELPEGHDDTDSLAAGRTPMRRRGITWVVLAPMILLFAVAALSLLVKLLGATR